jgi:hypothetical protein
MGPFRVCDGAEPDLRRACQQSFPPMKTMASGHADPVAVQSFGGTILRLLFGKPVRSSCFEYLAPSLHTNPRSFRACSSYLIGHRWSHASRYDLRPLRRCCEAEPLLWNPQPRVCQSSFGIAPRWRSHGRVGSTHCRIGRIPVLAVYRAERRISRGGECRRRYEPVTSPVLWSMHSFCRYSDRQFCEQPLWSAIKSTNWSSIAMIRAVIIFHKLVSRNQFTSWGTGQACLSHWNRKVWMRSF